MKANQDKCCQFISKKENVSIGSFFILFGFFFTTIYESQDFREYMIYVMRYRDRVCYDHDHVVFHIGIKDIPSNKTL